MIIPVGDENVKGGAHPVFSYLFIGLNISIFLYQVSLAPAPLETFIYTYSTIPIEIFHRQDLYTLVTSMFLHGSWMHLIFNMVFLWIFADNIEAKIGNFLFLIFYLGGGIFASLTHVFFNLESEVPSLGASGAISAVLGAYIVLFPHSRVKVILFLFIILRKIVMPAFVFLGIWILIQVLSGIQQFQTGELSTGGTAWWAHIGGFVYGLVLGVFIRVLPKPRQIGL